MLKGRGQLADAKVALERAVSIDERALSPNHRNSIEAANALAVLLMEQGDFSAARPLFERVLASRRETLGMTHHETLLSLNNLAVCLLEQGDLDASRHLLNEAKSSLDAIPEDSADMLFITLNNFGGVFFRSGDFPTALATWEQALNIAERIYGESHFLTALIHHNIGDLLREQENFEVARTHLERALQTWKQTLPPEHPHLSKCLFALGRCLSALGELGRAEELLRRCVTVRERIVGPRSTETAQAIAQLAVVLEQRGHWAEACSLHERALRICEETHASDDPSIGMCLYNLGRCQAHQGNVEAVEHLLTRALNNLRQSLGDNDPLTIHVSNDLQRVLEMGINGSKTSDNTNIPLED